MHARTLCALPARSPELEAESRRIAAATEAFLARGGEIEQVGAKMLDGPEPFVINPRRTPVYAHLFEQADATPAPAAPKPATAKQPVGRIAQPAPATPSPVALIRAWALLGRTPKEMAESLNIHEKDLRQLCRQHGIACRQR
ncbi:hypothetical protein PSCT_01186 [Pseudomonas sp. SCT]|uniref:hypothetical protein n=1 Tax=Pseudomonas sp. (strain SCT) TaxID=412955 RepID=UPI000EBF9E7E|nr:hypothetical protein [Pseudomonas sp. SCT]GCA55005.1 hypothetical protein PSCT_01186 [Pseudomonas sp. SCT]